MTKEKLPKLSDGSKWRDVGIVVTNIGESGIGIDTNNGMMFAYGPDYDVDPSFSSTDALAVIDRAGLDPVRIAARELVRALYDKSAINYKGARDIQWDDIADELKKFEALL